MKKLILTIIFIFFFPLILSGQKLVWKKTKNIITKDSTTTFVQSQIVSWKLYLFQNDIVQLVKTKETYRGVEWKVLFYGKTEVFLLYLNHNNQPKWLNRKLRRKVNKL